MKYLSIFYLFFLLVFLGCFKVALNQSTKNEKEVPSQCITDKIEWVPSTINRITLGKSKYDDVIRLWGKPSFEKEFVSQDEELENPDLETELGFRNVEIDGLKPSIGVLIDDETRLVTAISLFFDVMTKDEAIRKYGSDYYLISSQDSTCIDKTQKRRKDVGKLDYPIKLVYPQKGMSISVRDDNTVNMVTYSNECK